MWLVSRLFVQALTRRRLTQETFYFILLWLLLFKKFHGSHVEGLKCMLNCLETLRKAALKLIKFPGKLLLYEARTSKVLATSTAR